MLISTVEEQISFENGEESVKESPLGSNPNSMNGGETMKKEFPLGSKEISINGAESVEKESLGSTPDFVGVEELVEKDVGFKPDSINGGDSRKESPIGSNPNFIDGEELVEKEISINGREVRVKESTIVSNPITINGGELMKKESPIGLSNPNSFDVGELVREKSPTGSNPNSINGGESSKEESPIGSNQNSESPKSTSETASFADALNLAREREKEQLEQIVLSLEEEVACLRQRHKSFDDKRREALNKILDLKGSIRVFCRVRPFFPTDKRSTHQPIMVESEKIVVKSGGSKKEFGFDKVFTEEATQEHVYVEVQPILRSALDGCNVCILAYGQSGTGKTFTMDGTSDSPGILPRALEELFRQASIDKTTSFTFSISMLEVYLGYLRDLLAQKPSRRVYAVSKCNLNIQTDSKGSVEIDGLTEVEVSNFTKARWWYNKGRRARSTSWTNVNEASSRSHCLTRITIYRSSDDMGGKSEVSKLWLVDLGGSERLLKTGATGQTLDEGRAINLSLSALGDVIAALRRKKGHVPYRNSKLTQILRDSLGDGSKVLMLVHISPCEEDVGETTHSSTFAKRARAVESFKELPEDTRKQKEDKIAEFEGEMKEAEEECLKLTNQIQKVELVLSENKRFLTMNNQRLEDEAKSPPLSPIENKNNHEQAPLTPRITDKAIRRNSNNSLPRFMNPTVASLERRTAAEREMDGWIRNLRSGTRSSMQTSASQSFSYPDSRFKSMLKNPSRKSRYAESATTEVCPPIESSFNTDSNSKPTTTVPRGKVATTASDSNLRVPIIRHKRRMSDLI
ncbi:hypothetical protein LguiB_024178 [Lonicera macranthoides]